VAAKLQADEITQYQERLEGLEFNCQLIEPGPTVTTVFGERVLAQKFSRELNSLLNGRCHPA